MFDWLKSHDWMVTWLTAGGALWRPVVKFYRWRSRLDFPIAVGGMRWLWERREAIRLPVIGCAIGEMLVLNKIFQAPCAFLQFDESAVHSRDHSDGRNADSADGPQQD